MSDFNFGAFLDVARALATNEDEASKRSSVSRAYYAGYHSAKSSLLPHAGQHLRDRDREHYNFWQAIRTDHGLRGISSLERLGQISALGNELRRRRVWADYDHGAWNDETADEVMAYVFTNVEALFAEVNAALAEVEQQSN